MLIITHIYIVTRKATISLYNVYFRSFRSKLSGHSAAHKIKHWWKFTSGFIGPQILNFERSLSLSPVPQSSLVPPGKIHFGGLVTCNIVVICNIFKGHNLRKEIVVVLMIKQIVTDWNAVRQKFDTNVIQNFTRNPILLDRLVKLNYRLDQFMWTLRSSSSLVSVSFPFLTFLTYLNIRYSLVKEVFFHFFLINHMTSFCIGDINIFETIWIIIHIF